MIKSDRQRLLQALGRHELRYLETHEATDVGPFHSLAAAVDWLRAEYRLIERFLDTNDPENGWIDAAYDYLWKSEKYIAGCARELAEEIRKEVKI